jgi:hypothetical protein
LRAARNDLADRMGWGCPESGHLTCEDFDLCWKDVHVPKASPIEFRNHVVARLGCSELGPLEISPGRLGWSLERSRRTKPLRGSWSSLIRTFKLSRRRLILLVTTTAQRRRESNLQFSEFRTGSQLTIDSASSTSTSPEPQAVKYASASMLPKALSSNSFARLVASLASYATQVFPHDHVADGSSRSLQIRLWFDSRSDIATL